MQIKDVRAHVLEAALSEPFSWSLGWTRTRTALLVEIETADGLLGWGESYGPARPNAAVIEAMEPLLIGADALASEALGSGSTRRFAITARRGCRSRRSPGSTSRSGISRASISACPCTV